MESGLESKAIICEGESRDDFTVKTLTVKAPGADEVRIKMKYATFSVHDTTQHAVTGHKAGEKSEYPFLAGYDGVGVVDEIGENVEEFEKGDYVAIFQVPGNHTLRDKSNISDFFAKMQNSKVNYWGASPHLNAYEGVDGLQGLFGLGTWSQYANIPCAHLLKLDHEPTVSDAGLGSVGCKGLMTPTTLFNVEENSVVAVFGSNSIGIALIDSLKSLNCSKIVVVGATADQELVEKIGATFIADEGEPTDVQTKLLEASADGYDYTFNTSDFSRFGTVALEVWHKGWGKCALISKSLTKDAIIKTKPFQLVTGRHWVGSVMGNVNISKHHEQLLKTHKDHSESLNDLIYPSDHIVSIDDFPSKWKDLSSTATYHRTVIEF